MKTLFIVRSLLPPYKRHRYMRDDNCYDYLGQILLQLGHNIPDKMRYPMEMGKVIAPFTFPSRGSIHDTALTTEILKLDLLDPMTHPQKLAALLPQFEFIWK